MDGEKGGFSLKGKSPFPVANAADGDSGLAAAHICTGECACVGATCVCHCQSNST